MNHHKHGTVFTISNFKVVCCSIVLLRNAAWNLKIELRLFKHLYACDSVICFEIKMTKTNCLPSQKSIEKLHNESKANTYHKHVWGAIRCQQVRSHLRKLKIHMSKRGFSNDISVLPLAFCCKSEVDAEKGENFYQ